VLLLQEFCDDGPAEDDNPERGKDLPHTRDDALQHPVRPEPGEEPEEYRSPKSVKKGGIRNFAPATVIRIRVTQNTRSSSMQEC
jgi:hypothetical protein